MNPYSTNRAITSWQNGYEGKPLSILDWIECYQRGVNARFEYLQSLNNKVAS